MRRLHIRKNIKISKVLLLIGALVFFFTTILFKTYSNNINGSLINFAKIKINEIMQKFLSESIGYDLLKKEDMDEILVITKNKDGEILYVDYDLDKSYKLLDKVTKKINEDVTNLENRGINNKNVINSKNGFALVVPLFLSSNNALVASFGPKIYVPINFVGAILTNIKSKVTNYGMNNALVELYITIKLTTNIVTPMDSSSEIIDYDVLIASKIINGRVPEVYGGLISSQSEEKSIPIE